MKKTTKVLICIVVSLTIAIGLFMFTQTLSIAVNEDSPTVKIIFLIDVSGSMKQADDALHPDPEDTTSTPFEALRLFVKLLNGFEPFQYQTILFAGSQSTKDAVFPFGENFISSTYLLDSKLDRDLYNTKEIEDLTNIEYALTLVKKAIETDKSVTRNNSSYKVIVLSDFHITQGSSDATVLKTLYNTICGLGAQFLFLEWQNDDYWADTVPNMTDIDRRASEFSGISYSFRELTETVEGVSWMIKSIFDMFPGYEVTELSSSEWTTSNYVLTLVTLIYYPENSDWENVGEARLNAIGEINAQSSSGEFSNPSAIEPYQFISIENALGLTEWEIMNLPDGVVVTVFEKIEPHVEISSNDDDNEISYTSSFISGRLGNEYSVNERYFMIKKGEEPEYNQIEDTIEKIETSKNDNLNGYTVIEEASIDISKDDYPDGYSVIAVYKVSIGETPPIPYWEKVVCDRQFLNTKSVYLVYTSVGQRVEISAIDLMLNDTDDNITYYSINSNMENSGLLYDDASRERSSFERSSDHKRLALCFDNYGTHEVAVIIKNEQNVQSKQITIQIEVEKTNQTLLIIIAIVFLPLVVIIIIFTYRHKQRSRT